MRSCVNYQDLCADIVLDLGFGARLVEQTASQAIIDKYPIEMSTSALQTGLPSDVHIQTTYHFRIGSSQQVGHATNAFVAKDQRRSRPAVYSLRHESVSRTSEHNKCDVSTTHFPNIPRRSNQMAPT